MPAIKLVGQLQRDHAKRQIDAAPDNWVVQIGEETRTIEQNMKMWPMLKDMSEQILWHGIKMNPDSWKDFATATMKKIGRAHV